ncbi:hypothetical protein INS49_014370 [Diaporthe citri]|uniref:uncharacterized protein n=1 Tax=Diaporthe citri TaxID=83186 RepID=UPI001C7E231A|nr:uncharacterized protein INS49_014370 [Diaporthe citri]KAG6358486.1 hypothetical protein INS49_014370 [Diaporthe citri]
MTTSIVVAYPTYLSRFEKFGDFDKWRFHCLRIIRSVCKDHPDIQFRTANEGQCAGVYLSEEFDDPQGGLRREKLQAHFGTLRLDGDMLWVVVDGGSSTFNMQGLAFYFDEKLQVEASQSVSGPGWSPGTRGGSNLLDEKVQGLCRPQLEELSVDLQDDKLAAVMKDFEEQKWG